MYYNDISVYQKKFDDELGIFFTEDTFPALKNTNDDITDVLQDAIDILIKEQCYGILYIPEGTYKITRTIYIPPSVRLIGYGKKRPVFVLPANTKGFDGNEAFDDSELGRMMGGYPGANYMFWFIGDSNTNVYPPKDASAATFYSALTNIDFKIEEGNPGAVCIRAHFAQHGFISHCKFDLGDGLSALFDVGNEMEDLTFIGGSYGILCRMCSPGWPFALLDCVFDGQKKAAIASGTTGFTAFRLHIKNTPKAFDLYLKGSWEKLYIEDCIFENISDAAVTMCQTNSIIQQTNIRRLSCKNVPRLIYKELTDEYLTVDSEIYDVAEYSYGYTYEEGSEPSMNETFTMQASDTLKKMTESDIPPIPSMSDWVSVKKYGAVGDGEADDTKALQEAFDNEKILYLPQGIYRVSDTLKMPEGLTLYGLSPITTQLVIIDDTPAFSGFGTPKPILETACGGFAYVNGIGIDTAGKNPRAAGIKWMAGERSYMNDVKFVGGHGLMFRDGRNAYGYLYNPGRTADYDPDRIWDYQYSSLWITNGGGGIFKDLWSASPYAESGITITNTETPGKMYAISLEHHVRSEIKLHNVKNWALYAIQTEEEKAEGLECLPMELVSCENILIANYFIFRVVAVNRTYETAVKVWNCRNIEFLNLHNKAQMQYVFTLSLKDENSGFIAKSPEYAKLIINGSSPKMYLSENGYEVIGSGCSFAQGAAFDSKGNLYWCDKLYKRIYKYDVSNDFVVPVYDIHFIPSALAFDSEDNLIVAVDYSELRKTVPGQHYLSIDFSNYHPFFSWFYKRSERVYTISADDPFNTMNELTKVPANEFTPQTVIRPAELDYPGMFKTKAEEIISSYYPAPDKATAIAGTIDLARSLVLSKTAPNEEFLIADNSSRIIYSYTADDKGNLSSPKALTDRGQYSVGVDGDILWAAEDMLYGLTDGKVVKQLPVPFDAYAVISNNSAVYILGRSKIYRFK